MCLHGSSDAHRQKNGWSWSSGEQGWAYRGHVPDLLAVFWQTDQSGSLHKRYRADSGRSRHGEETKCCSIMRLFFIHLFTIGRKKILVNCHSLSCSKMPFIFPFYSVNQQLLTSFKISGSKNEQNWGVFVCQHKLIQCKHVIKLVWEVSNGESIYFDWVIFSVRNWWGLCGGAGRQQWDRWSSFIQRSQRFSLHCGLISE